MFDRWCRWQHGVSVERSAGCEPLITVPGELFIQFRHEVIRPVDRDVYGTMRPAAQGARYLSDFFPDALIFA